MSTKVGILVDSVLDNGYTRVCPGCVKRWGETEFAVGRTRELELIRCPPCAVKVKPYVRPSQAKGKAQLTFKPSGMGYHPEVSRNHSLEL